MDLISQIEFHLEQTGPCDSTSCLLWDHLASMMRREGRCQQKIFSEHFKGTSLERNYTRYEVKFIEIRDRATFIPVMAVKVTPGDDHPGFITQRSGWHNGFLQLTRLGDQTTCFDYGEQHGRTMSNAHPWIETHWDEDGDVVDVEFILGERSSPKRSERLC